jgi:2-keto-4-pentenoate hydratase/2-oxohepta-3-ene-1,7-dioic acid hydratase in catechol pathway
MRWATYESSGEHRVGLVDGTVIRAVRGASRLIDLLGDDGEQLAAAADQARANPLEVVDIDAVALLAPIPVPPSIRDFMAFEEHIRNTRKRTGDIVDPGWYDTPVFYFTNPAAVHPPVADIAISPGSVKFDYELEIAAIVSREGHDLAPADAENHIAGYTVLCDWSARDLQREEMRQRLGPAKGKDSATSLGPFLVTPDEVEPYRAGNGFDLPMTASVNGITCSEGNWSAIYWSFAEMLAYASRGTRLVPGDVFGSGTVGRGCLLELSTLYGEDACPWLQPGDEVALHVEILGTITGRITAGADPVPLRS